MPETAAYSSTTTEDQHVIKMTNPVKAWKNCTTDPASFLTVLCWSGKSDQLTIRSGAPDRVRIVVCLVHDTRNFSRKSDELTI